jgi:hypothetical protein
MSVHAGDICSAITESPRILGHLAAERLGTWPKYTASESALIEYASAYIGNTSPTAGSWIDKAV